MIGTTAILAAAANAAPVLQPGHGQLDLGLVTSPSLLGAGLRLDHRFRPWLSAFILGEAGYSPVLRQFNALGTAGVRLTW